MSELNASHLVVLERPSVPCFGALAPRSDYDSRLIEFTLSPRLGFAYTEPILAFDTERDSPHMLIDREFRRRKSGRWTTRGYLRDKGVHGWRLRRCRSEGTSYVYQARFPTALVQRCSLFLVHFLAVGFMMGYE